MNETQMLSFSEAICEAGFAVPEGLGVFEAAERLLPALGSTDPTLRERRAYTILYRWIAGGLFDEEELAALVARLCDASHLFHRIGEVDGDGVFLRAYSALLLAPLVHVATAQGSLGAADAARLVDVLVRYLDEEQDLRGFVEKKEWAHAVAHAADACAELAQVPTLDADALRALVHAVGRKATTAAGVWIHEEDERLARAAAAAIGRDVLPVAAVRGFIDGLLPERHWVLDGELPGNYFRYINTKHFFRSLWFRAQQDGLPAERVALLNEALARLRDSLARRE